MEPDYADMELEWELVLSTLQEMFGDVSPVPETKVPCDGDQPPRMDGLASGGPQESVPPHVTGGVLQELGSRTDVAQQDGCSLPVVTVAPGCYRSCIPPSVGYRPDCGCRLAGHENNWPIMESINCATQNYLGAIHRKRVFQVVTPPPRARSTAAASYVKPRQSEPVPVHNGPYIRRPPNAFMIFMRENRKLVMATLKPKHSVEANSILGHMWKSMTSEQQQKYYLLAAEERQKHAEQHPDWSSKDNYGRKVKRQRKKVRTESPLDPEGATPTLSSHSTDSGTQQPTTLLFQFPCK